MTAPVNTSEKAKHTPCNVAAADAKGDVAVRNPFRQQGKRQAFDDAVRMYNTKHANFFLSDGRPHRNNSWAGMFWRGFAGITIGKWDRASRESLAYPTWCAGRAIAKATGAAP